MTAAEDRAEERQHLHWMRVASVCEGTTLLALVLVAVPLKHLGGWPAATAVVGPVHGLAFVFYAWMLIQTVTAGGWGRAEIVRMVLAAFIPFGGFLNARVLARRQAKLQNPQRHC